VTIDGENARDFDDAISIDRLPNGNFWLGVHIADVAHYVGEGGALDEEAFERSTSVYFPERAVHMFPSELATGLCSLNPHVDRLVQSCLMEWTAGAVVHHE
jgi:ribonuclease R